MDKLKLTNHIKDEELKVKMYRVIDSCNSVLKSNSIRTTEFLNPYEVKNAVAILNTEPDLKYKLEGGYDGAIRLSLIHI